MKPKITIVTLATDHMRAFADLTFERNRRYAEKYGYGFAAYDKVIDDSRPASWSKIPALAENFEDNDWLLWIDADAAIMNMEIKLEELIDERFDFILTSDINGANCGVFLLKCSQYMEMMLDVIWDSKEFINHKWWEQGAVHELLKYDKRFKEATLFLRKDKLNSYYHDYEKGDFILHLPGTHNDTRYMIFKDMLGEKPNE